MRLCWWDSAKTGCWVVPKPSVVKKRKQDLAVALLMLLLTSQEAVGREGGGLWTHLKIHAHTLAVSLGRSPWCTSPVWPHLAIAVATIHSLAINTVDPVEMLTQTWQHIVHAHAPCENTKVDAENRIDLFMPKWDSTSIWCLLSVWLCGWVRMCESAPVSENNQAVHRVKLMILFFWSNRCVIFAQLLWSADTANTL